MPETLSIVADQQILLAREVFSKFGDVRLVDGRSVDQQTIEGANVLLVRSVTRVDESLLKDSKICFVGSATSGTDHIDLEYLRKSNIHFSYAHGSNARSVAEYVLSCIYVIAEHQGLSLSEITVGIIGCGQVGSVVKRFMDILGVHCLLNDPPLYEHSHDRSYSDLEQVLKADIITLHVPLTTDGRYPTSNLVDKKFLDRLKSDVVLINPSIGGIIDETELLAFKQTNPESTLILDVWCNEPAINTTLLQHSYIATPHIAGYSFDGKLRATEMLVNELNRFTKNDFYSDQLKNHEQVKEIIECADDDVIQLAVLQSYDVRSDAVALKNIKYLPSEELAIYFDSLRKNYPVRYEFTHRIIQSSMIKTEVIQQLQYLGFMVNSA